MNQYPSLPKQADAANAARVALNKAIETMYNNPPTKWPKWTYKSRPYLEAIVYDNYGLEDPEMCVLYALNNMVTWRGETARKIKLQLNEAIK